MARGFDGVSRKTRRMSRRSSPAAPRDLVSRESVLAYVEYLSRTNSSMTAFNRIEELYDAIRVMAPGLD